MWVWLRCTPPISLTNRISQLTALRNPVIALSISISRPEISKLTYVQVTSNSLKLTPNCSRPSAFPLQRRLPPYSHLSRPQAFMYSCCGDCGLRVARGKTVVSVIGAFACTLGHLEPGRTLSPSPLILFSRKRSIPSLLASSLANSYKPSHIGSQISFGQ